MISPDYMIMVALSLLSTSSLIFGVYCLLVLDDNNSFNSKKLSFLYNLKKPINILSVKSSQNESPGGITLLLSFICIAFIAVYLPTVRTLDDSSAVADVLLANNPFSAPVTIMLFAFVMLVDLLVLWSSKSVLAQMFLGRMTVKYVGLILILLLVHLNIYTVYGTFNYFELARMQSIATGSLLKLPIVGLVYMLAISLGSEYTNHFRQLLEQINDFRRINILLVSKVIQFGLIVIFIQLFLGGSNMFGLEKLFKDYSTTLNIIANTIILFIKFIFIALISIQLRRYLLLRRINDQSKEIILWMCPILTINLILNLYIF